MSGGTSITSSLFYFLALFEMGSRFSNIELATSSSVNYSDLYGLYSLGESYGSYCALCVMRDSMSAECCSSASRCSGGCQSMPFPLSTFMEAGKVGDRDGSAMAMSLAGVS